jgi:hypothetical protein
MFRKIRQLNISLAAKCQLLFGAAVVLIIGAALLVPWQRMEQLTEQLNERSARTLIEYAVDAHGAKPQTATESEPSTAATAATTRRLCGCFRLRIRSVIPHRASHPASSWRVRIR